MNVTNTMTPLEKETTMLKIHKLIGLENGSWTVFDVRFASELDARDIADIVTNERLAIETAAIVHSSASELNAWGNGLHVSASPLAA